MKASVKVIKDLRIGSWGGFKHHLVRMGVISNVDCDVPEDWKKAFCKAFGRPYPMK